jgi:hypothetical protein
VPWLDAMGPLEGQTYQVHASRSAEDKLGLLAEFLGEGVSHLRLITCSVREEVDVCFRGDTLFTSLCAQCLPIAPGSDPSKFCAPCMNVMYDKICKRAKKPWIAAMRERCKICVFRIDAGGSWAEHVECGRKDGVQCVQVALE